MSLGKAESKAETRAREFAENADTNNLNWVDYLVLLGVLVAGLWSFWWVGATPWRFAAGIPDMVDFSRNLYPPSVGYITSDLPGPIIETVAIAIASTMIAVFISIPIAFGAAKNTTPAKPVWVVCRGIISLTRTIHELIWALIFVVAIGLGAFAGVLGLAFHAIGFMGKLVSEEIEDIDDGQIEAMKATGASSFAVLRYGVVPQILPAFIGLSLYRWDINLRSSVIVGIVGAGGIGYELQQAMMLFNYQNVSAILLVIFILVGLEEGFSSWVRHRII